MATLALHDVSKAVNHNGDHHPWPVITDSIRNAALEQINDAVSIYIRSGIFEQFEDDFCSMHEHK